MIDFLSSDDHPWGEAFGVAAVVVPALLAAWGMRRAHRRRRAREEEALGPLPDVTAPHREADLRVLYTGTTWSGSRASRVVAHGLFGRGPADVWVEPGALTFRRYRGPAVRVTAPVDAGLVGAHAGRVVAPERVVVVTWRLGGEAVDSGLACDDTDTAHALLEHVEALHSPVNAPDEAVEVGADAADRSPGGGSR